MREAQASRYAAPISATDRDPRSAVRVLDAARSHVWFAAAIEAASIGIAITDPHLPDNPVVFVNPAFSLITGYGPEEVIGRNCRFLQGRETDPAKIAEIRVAIERQRSIRCELLNYGKDGTPFWNDVTISPIFDDEGELLGYLSVMADISGRKHMEQALAASEERFRDFAETGADWFWETDPLLRFTFFSNEKAPILRGRRPASWGDVSSELGKHLAGCVARREPFRHVEFCLPEGDEETWIRISGKPVIDSSGALVAYRGVGTDVSARHRAEQAMREARDAAELANRTKSEFLANISHELRTPLNAIIGFSQIMRDGLFGPVENAQYQDYVRDIHDSGRHLLEVINDILDVAKIEAGKIQLQEDFVAVDRLLEAVFRIVSERAENAGLKLQSSLCWPTPVIRADEKRMKQILLNLLSNAIKFTLEGGEVGVSVHQATDGLRIAVRDTGIGIAPENMELALAPFGQVDSRLSRKFEGTGLGLPLTKALVELHGGHLELESAVGVGTTATVVIPSSRIAE